MRLFKSHLHTIRSRLEIFVLQRKKSFIAKRCRFFLSLFHSFETDLVISGIPLFVRPSSCSHQKHQCTSFAYTFAPFAAFFASACKLHGTNEFHLHIASEANSRRKFLPVRPWMRQDSRQRRSRIATHRNLHMACTWFNAEMAFDGFQSPPGIIASPSVC